MLVVRYDTNGSAASPVKKYIYLDVEGPHGTEGCVLLRVLFLVLGSPPEKSFAPQEKGVVN